MVYLWHRFWIAVAIIVWASGVEAQLDWSKLVSQWEVQNGTSIASLINAGGKLIAIDNVRYGDKEFVRYHYIQKSNRLYRCSETVQIDGLDSITTRTSCSVSVEPK
jgi:hypothetical protein